MTMTIFDDPFKQELPPEHASIVRWALVIALKHFYAANKGLYWRRILFIPRWVELAREGQFDKAIQERGCGAGGAVIQGTCPCCGYTPMEKSTKRKKQNETPGKNNA